MKRKGLSVRNVRPNGAIEWRNEEGELHREDGPAKEWPARGAKAWYRDGKLHREDGPAMDGPLGKSWYRNGRKHRDDGPAVILADGRVEWYRNGRQLTAAEVKKKLEELGEAFTTGLDHKVTVKTIGKLKTSSEVRKSTDDTGREK